MEQTKFITVVATERGYRDSRIIEAGQEFSVPEGQIPRWAVEKGAPLPKPPKPFVRTIKDLVKQTDPDEVAEVGGQKRQINTLSGMARRRVLEEERAIAAKTAEPTQTAQQKAAKTEK